MYSSFSPLRALARTFFGAALLFAAHVPFAPLANAAERPQVQAQLLDHAELDCSNCFFGPTDRYFCFAVGDKVLIGYQRTPVLNWQDSSKNYFTRAVHRWKPWVAPGEMLPISYDEKHIWVQRDTGKQVKLTQNYSLDIFTNDRCRAALKTPAH